MLPVNSTIWPEDPCRTFFVFRAVPRPAKSAAVPSLIRSCSSHWWSGDRSWEGSNQKKIFIWVQTQRGSESCLVVKNAESITDQIYNAEVWHKDPIAENIFNSISPDNETAALWLDSERKPFDYTCRKRFSLLCWTETVRLLIALTRYSPPIQQFVMSKESKMKEAEK